MRRGSKLFAGFSMAQGAQKFYPACELVNYRNSHNLLAFRNWRGF